ncbi:hypothetical protein ABW21_db0206597 [Orbilia brochopaga]|nr:hypothetical protein ABW21_db0206597 [Drechslerella brochopaga]
MRIHMPKIPRAASNDYYVQGCSNSGDPEAEKECTKKHYIAIGSIFAGIIGLFLLMGGFFWSLNYIRGWRQARRIKKASKGVTTSTNTTPADEEIEMGNMSEEPSATPQAGNANGSDAWNRFRSLANVQSPITRTETNTTRSGDQIGNMNAGAWWRMPAWPWGPGGDDAPPEYTNVMVARSKDDSQ